MYLTAYWGNDDADSTIRMSRRRWAAIQAGAEYWADATSWYEGKRSYIGWTFANGNFSISGEDGMDCIVDEPVEELIVWIG